jgi:hypothetical protein
MLIIYHFHKTNSVADARKYLASAIKPQNFKDHHRIERIELKLEPYLKWVGASAVSVADSRIRINLNSGFVTLMGEISRLDVTKQTYRAVILVNKIPPDWAVQLRMPLIQLAISHQFGRPLEEVEVAFQRLDGSGPQSASYEAQAVADAELRFARLAKELKKIDSEV